MSQRAVHQPGAIHAGTDTRATRQAPDAGTGSAAAVNAAARIDLATLTGAGIKIGIVDSGCAQARAKVRIGGGVSLTGDAAQIDLPQTTPQGTAQDWEDRIGHGTACAGIIARKAPDAVLYAIRIFDQELVSDTVRLVEAIHWGCTRGLDVLNLSLGTTDLSASEEMTAACRAANEQGLMIVAATSNDGQPSVPASLPGVFGVAAGKIKGKYQYYFDADAAIQFVARGDSQRLDWLGGEQVFLGGTSFAAPHASAIIALLLERFPGISFEELGDILQRLSLPQRPAQIDAADVKAGLRSQGSLTRSTVPLADLHDQNDLQWIGKAVVYPFNKEMHSLVRGRELLCFDLVGVVDVVGGRNIGKDSGEAIGAGPSGIVVEKDLETALADADTVVLGYLDQISRIKKHDHLEEVLELALRLGKNVYSLSPIDEQSYPGMAARFRDKGLRVASPLVTQADFEAITAHFDWRHESRVPVVGIFGTSPSQGKFTAQLALRSELQRIGYKVGQIGTEHQSALFGFDYTFPNGYDGHRSVQIPLDVHVPLLQAVIAGIEQTEPQVILVGTQSGVIPYSFAEKTPGYTLTTIAVLFGTLPDAYVLAVNSMDEVEFIEQTMDVLKALGKGETIALVFSDKKKEEGTHLGRAFVTTQQMTADEIEETTKKLEAHFGIPVTAVVSAAGRRKLATAVEDFFDAEAEVGTKCDTEAAGSTAQAQAVKGAEA